MSLSKNGTNCSLQKASVFDFNTPLNIGDTLMNMYVMNKSDTTYSFGHLQWVMLCPWL